MSMRDAAMRWQLPGSGAEAYERYLVPPIFAPRADRLLDATALAQGERVLDAACGTGIVARQATARVGDGGAVTGVDVNEGMLAVARDASRNARPPITWEHADVMDLPFPDNAFDVVVCQEAMQFFPDAVGALREMRRVLVPGGRVAFSVWRAIAFNPGYVPLAVALERYVGDDAGAGMRSPFQGWDKEEIRDMVTRAGFEDARVTIDVSDVRFQSVDAFLQGEVASAPFRDAVTGMDADTRDALLRDLTAGLADHVDDDGVVFPMETHVVVARA